MAEQIKKISSRAIPLRGDDIDTDRIIPARFLKCITFDGLGEHAFEDDRFDESGKSKNHVFDENAYKGAHILLVNKNFGCGSSREHAPQALQKYGIKAIIGESFAEIFFGNCISLGIPCLVVSEAEIGQLQSAIENFPEKILEIDLEQKTVSGEGISFSLKLSDPVQELFLSGFWDITGVLLDNAEKIDVVAGRLPYLKW